MLKAKIFAKRGKFKLDETPSKKWDTHISIFNLFFFFNILEHLG